MKLSGHRFNLPALRRHRSTALAVAALLAGAGAARATTPLRMDFCVDSQGGGLYTYTFTLTLDNHDGTWAPGQGWAWLTFGATQTQTSPLHDFAMTSAFPVGPWT